jgi:hypothetical protein
MSGTDTELKTFSNSGSNPEDKSNYEVLYLNNSPKSNSNNNQNSVINITYDDYISHLEQFKEQLLNLKGHLLEYKKEKERFLAKISASTAFLTRLLMLKPLKEIQNAESKIKTDTTPDGAKIESVMETFYTILEREAPVQPEHLPGYMSKIIAGDNTIGDGKLLLGNKVNMFNHTESVHKGGNIEIKKDKTDLEKMGMMMLENYLSKNNRKKIKYKKPISKKKIRI